MQCPRSDGELQLHTAVGEDNLIVHYSTCPNCHGYWLESFDANYIKSVLGAVGGPVTQPLVPYHCPVCQKELERARGSNIPDSCIIFKCPNSHGYYFPEGQLAAWKQAQEIKISYHKTWNIPLVSVAAVLLASIFVLGFYFSYQGIQPAQTSTQAKQSISLTHAYVQSNIRQVLISATSAEKTQLTLYIPQLNNFKGTMESKDGIVHTLLVKNVPAGTYEYYFTWVSDKATVSSDRYSFTMP